MLLATTTVEDFDRFVKIFSTKGAEKRKQHGSKGSTVFRDPNEDDRVWAIFDWDAEGWQSFASDPEVPAIMQEAGHKGRPQVAGARRPVRRLGTISRTLTADDGGALNEYRNPRNRGGFDCSRLGMRQEAVWRDRVVVSAWLRGPGCPQRDSNPCCHLERVVT